MQPTRTTQIDWPAWTPTERATLLFVITGGRILLIHKKQGLGAGKINGPGGRLEAGETPEQAAVRETQEELCITPVGVTHAGTLRFQFYDGYALAGDVFTASGYEGDPTETDEAIPVWAQVDDIPYDNMWADDRLWMPLMLKGIPFEGQFIFDGDRMVDHDVIVTQPCASQDGPR